MTEPRRREADDRARSCVLVDRDERPSHGRLLPGFGCGRCSCFSMASSSSRRSSRVSFPASTSCAIIGCARPPKRLSTSSSSRCRATSRATIGSKMCALLISGPAARRSSLPSGRPWSGWSCTRGEARGTLPGSLGWRRCRAPTGARGSAVRVGSVVVGSCDSYYVALDLLRHSGTRQQGFRHVFTNRHSAVLLGEIRSQSASHVGASMRLVRLCGGEGSGMPATSQIEWPDLPKLQEGMRLNLRSLRDPLEIFYLAGVWLPTIGLALVLPVAFLSGLLGLPELGLILAFITMFWMFNAITWRLLLAFVRGHSIEVGPHEYPQIYELVQDASRLLEVKHPPRVDDPPWAWTRGAPGGEVVREARDPHSDVEPDRRADEVGVIAATDVPGRAAARIRSRPASSASGWSNTCSAG